MHLAPGAYARVQLDFTKGGFITRNILLQESKQSFGLLWAQVDALEIANFHLCFVLLLHRAEHQEEVPDIHSHLHAVGIGFPIIGGMG